MDRIAARRTLIEVAKRRHPVGAGSDVRALMEIPRSPLGVSISEVFEGLPFVVIGEIATREYMPERFTKGLDVIVAAEAFGETAERLKRAGWIRGNDLVFPNSGLELRGAAWRNGDEELDLICSDGAWADEAIATGQSKSGMPVISLPYLVLMKLDSGRTQDTSDVGRMLALTDESTLGQVREVVGRHGTDSCALEDLESLLTIGRWELGSESS